jgi:hypothetical protein
MRRKTIFWIVAAVLAAAVLAAVGIVAYHVGFNHGSGRSVAVGPLSRGGFVAPRVVVGGAAGFSAAASLLLLLIGGAVGAAIGYLAWGSRAAGATAAQPAFVPAGGPVNPLWQQFDQWHRSVHATPGPAIYEAPTMATPAAPPVATSTPSASGAPTPVSTPAPPEPVVTPDPPQPVVTEPPEPPQPSGTA